MLDVLVIAPHPDDAELGMAGAILKFKKEGWRVGVLDLTSGEPTPHGSPEIRARETAAATKILGLDWRDNLGLPNRSLEATIENRAKLAGVIRQQRPLWLFAPYWIDAHPDHVAATQLVEAARFWSKLTKTDLPGAPHHPERIFNYYCVHLKMAPQPAFVLDISDEWDQKLAATPLLRKPVHYGPANGAARVSRCAARRGGVLGKVHRQNVWRAIRLSRADRAQLPCEFGLTGRTRPYAGSSILHAPRLDSCVFVCLRHRAKRFDAMLDLSRLPEMIRHEQGVSRRLFLAYAASLTSVPLLGRSAKSATRRPQFSADPFSVGVASGDPTHARHRAVDALGAQPAGAGRRHGAGADRSGVGNRHRRRHAQRRAPRHEHRHAAARPLGARRSRRS